MSAELPLGPDVAAVVEAVPARRACVVLLGGRPFAVDVMDAREVVLVDATTTVPGAPATVVGVMHLRGRVLAVIEARPLLGMPVPPASGRPRALVVADGDHRAAVLIDRVVGLAAFDEIEPLPSPPTDGLVAGYLVDEAGDRIAVLDVRALLVTVRAAWTPDGLSRAAVPSTPGA